MCGRRPDCCYPTDKEGNRIFWIHSWAADLFFAILIIVSTVLLGVDIELSLRQVAEDWRDVISWVQFGLLLLFVVELLLRVRAEGLRYFLLCSNTLDAVIIFFSLAEYVVVAAMGQSVLLNALAVMRIFRLLRILRVVRLVRVCPQLYSICVSLMSAIRAVSWVFLLLFVFMYISALSCTVLLSKSEVPLVRDTFGSVFSSIYMHFVILTVEGFPELVAAIAEENGWLWYIYFVCYILFTNIMVMNTVTGVICQTVVTQGAQEAGVKAQCFREFEKLKEVVLDCMVLEGLQYEVDDTMGFEVFKQVMRNPGVRASFDAVEICLDLSEDQLFNIIDENGDGRLSFEEFFQSLWRLRGSKERLHSLLVQADIVHTHKRVKERMVQLGEDLEDYQREECSELRDKLGEQVQSMADNLEARRVEEAQKRQEAEDSARRELNELLEAAQEATATARDTLSKLEERVAAKRARVGDLEAQLLAKRQAQLAESQRQEEEAQRPEGEGEEETAEAEEPSQPEAAEAEAADEVPLLRHPEEAAQLDLETVNAEVQSENRSPTLSAPNSPLESPVSPAMESASPGSSVGEGAPSTESPNGKRVRERERMASRRRLEELHRKRSADAEARRVADNSKNQRLLQSFQRHASATRSVAKAATFESSSSGDESTPEPADSGA